MKRTIGLAALMLTAVAAFAQPAAAYERYNGCNDGRKTVVVEQRDNRGRDRHEGHELKNARPVQYDRNRR